MRRSFPTFRLNFSFRFWVVEVTFSFFLSLLDRDRRQRRRQRKSQADDRRTGGKKRTRKTRRTSRFFFLVTFASVGIFLLLPKEKQNAFWVIYFSPEILTSAFCTTSWWKRKLLLTDCKNRFLASRGQSVVIMLPALEIQWREKQIQRSDWSE